MKAVKIEGLAMAKALLPLPCGRQRSATCECALRVRQRRSAAYLAGRGGGGGSTSTGSAEDKLDAFEETEKILFECEEERAWALRDSDSEKKTITGQLYPQPRSRVSLSACLRLTETTLRSQGSK
jgi:hypothetical protein